MLHVSLVRTVLRFLSLMVFLAPVSMARGAEPVVCPPGGHVVKQLTNDRGQLVEEITYNDCGQRDGQTILYYPNGSVRETESFVRDNPDGVWTYWFEDGSEREERSYTAGKLNGVRKRWERGGQPDGMECFIAGERRELDDCLAVLESPRQGRGLASVPSHFPARAPAPRAN